MRKAEPVLLEPSVSYTALFNLLDYAAGTTRVTEVDERDLQLMETSYPQSDPWYRLAKESAKVCRLPIYLSLSLLFQHFNYALIA